MAINPILSAVASALAQQSAPTSVNSPVSVSTDNTTPATTNVTDSSPSQSVVQNASLLSASSSFAQLGSLLQVAQSGTEQISDILQQLQALAQQASENPPEPASLSSEFQQLLSQINDTVSGTTFGGTSLLDGTLSGTSSDTQAQSLSLPNLTTQGLFGSTNPDISTPAAANAALEALGEAGDTVDDTQTAISNVTQQVGFASATVDSALANSTAASSTLTESDLSDGDLEDVFAGLLSKPAQTTQAQTGNLGNLLSLLQE